MLGEVAGRDRLVMAGLVVLGLLTVVAGVVSGRSTISYVLNRDAREAALSEAAKLDGGLSAQALSASRPLNEDVQTLDGGKLFETFAGAQDQPATLPPDRGMNEDGFNLLGGMDQMILSWMAHHSKRPVGEQVSKLDGFAVLNADKTPLALGRGLSRAALRTISSAATTSPPRSILLSTITPSPSRTLPPTTAPIAWPSCR